MENSLGIPYCVQSPLDLDLHLRFFTIYKSLLVKGTRVPRGDTIRDSLIFTAGRRLVSNSGSQFVSCEPPSLTAQTLPVYIRRGHAHEQVVLAYFPAGPSGAQLSSRITAVCRNNVDGRVRCELSDSTIHGREETSEGIPIDYQLICQSSTVPFSAYRTNYHAVKRDGKLYLTPIDVVHMKTVLEPKGVRNETQRVGIVSHGFQQANRADPAASTGKWISFKPNLTTDPSCLNVDGKNILNNPSLRVEDDASFQIVIDCALALGPQSCPTGSKTSLPMATTDVGSSMSALFKGSRVQRTAVIQKKMNKPVEETIGILSKNAYLVQGNWVGPGSLFFKAGKGVSIPFSMCFDYLLYYFHKDSIVDISVPNKLLNLKKDSLLSLTKMVSQHMSGERWKFCEEPDKEFMQSYPDIVRQQRAAWEERRLEIERFVAEWQRQSAVGGVNADAQNNSAQAAEETTANPAAGPKSVKSALAEVALLKGKQKAIAKPTLPINGAAVIHSRNSAIGKRSFSKVDPPVNGNPSGAKRRFTRSAKR
ncbi:uncharacterized protein LOC129586357 [Paramacrobiotus metropolitanus]|uniref:uncharacterized protein LOC129586357 n=1 Tax=Paramacrobiotus metropolitanus TaxID=2943436 RepID=UPI0024459C32|nr:uncharacterized protein LOC129586357 [Paramacrobiotus metropolitanus]